MIDLLFTAYLKPENILQIKNFLELMIEILLITHSWGGNEVDSYFS